MNTQSEYINVHFVFVRSGAETRAFAFMPRLAPNPLSNCTVSIKSTILVSIKKETTKRGGKNFQPGEQLAETAESSREARVLGEIWIPKPSCCGTRGRREVALAS